MTSTLDSLIDREKNTFFRGAASSEYEQKILHADPLPSWYAVHVKSRHESVAAGGLQEKRIEAFLPVVKKTNQWKDRKKLIEYPLFPGYLFVRVIPSPDRFLAVLKTRGVLTFISLEPGIPTAVTSDEILALQILMKSGREINIYPHLKEGTPVRIKSGPLRNAEGILGTREHEHFFQVNISILGRSVGITLSADEIEPI
ncbi:MAG: UpxY family transcription antiterminator [Nitrospirota bacterium]